MENVAGPNRFDHGKCLQRFPNNDVFQRHKLSQYFICYRKDRYLKDVYCSKCGGDKVYVAFKATRCVYLAHCSHCNAESRTRTCITTTING